MPKVTYRSRWSSQETFHLLLALSLGPQTCTDLQRQVVADSTGGIYVPTSSLYRWLANAQERGLVTTTTNPWVKPITYHLTYRGQRALSQFGHNYTSLAHLTRQRLP